MAETELSKYFLSRKVPYIKPLYAVKLSDNDAILQWFREAESGLIEYFRPLFREQKDNLAMFLAAGVHPNFSTPFAATFANTSDLYSTPQNVFINEMYRVIMDQVSLVCSNELVADVLPNSTDYSDRVAATVVKEWLDSVAYTMDFDTWRFKFETQKKIFGESFAVPMWNPNKGDLHPLAKQMVDEDAELIDNDGNPITDLLGRPVKIDKNMRIGDFDLLNPYPWDVMIDPKLRYEDSDWFYIKEYLDVEYLKKKYSKFDWDDSKGRADPQWDAYSNSEKDDPNRRTIFYLFHRATEFMPEGRYIVCSKSHVLKNEPMSTPTLIDSQTLPLVRFQDMDIGIGSRGVPMLFRNNKNLAEAYNRLTNQEVANTEMESPKFFIPRNSNVDAGRMENGIVAVVYDGAVKPSVDTPATNTSSIMAVREQIKKNIDEMSLQTPMVRGDVPNAQLDSYVALQHFEDLRNQLAAPGIKDHIKGIEKLYRLLMSIGRDKYRPDDGRLIKILGKHNSYQLKYFDPINLQKSYDVRITTTGNLANSKAARTQMMISIKRDFPHLISDDLFMDALQLTHSKKFMNAMTSAIASAEAENLDMLDGREVLAPTRYEDLIAHWETHRIPMQSLDFKHAPDDVKDLFLGHLAATEKLMIEQAAESPEFYQRLSLLKQFPCLYTARPVNETIPTDLAAPTTSTIQPLPLPSEQMAI